VKSVDTVTGPYDIVAVIEGKSLNDVGDLVTGKIHLIAGITRTVTCLANANNEFLAASCPRGNKAHWG